MAKNSRKKPPAVEDLAAEAAVQAETQKLADQLARRDSEVAELRKKLKAAQQREKWQAEKIENLETASFAAPPKTKRRRRASFARVIIPDTHGSIIDREAASAFLQDLKAIGPQEIVMLGDHVDCGGFLAQHHTMGYVAQTSYTFEEDIRAANWFLDEVQQAAPSAAIHYLEGNHEQRVEKWIVTQTLRHSQDAEFLRKQFGIEVQLRLQERGIKFYRRSERYHGLRVPGTIKLGNCCFTHGDTTAKHAASVMLAKFGGCVVFGHTHRMDSAADRNVGHGEIGAWNPGCLCELQPLWRHTTVTGWTHGYGLQFVSKSGRFLHLNVPIIDGESYFVPIYNQAV